MRVDSVAPETTILTGPSGPINQSSATFTFTSSEAYSSFQCQLDAGAWEACSSPKTYTGLSNGTHTFRVRATDLAGNTDQTPATRSFETFNYTIDYLPPLDDSVVGSPIVINVGKNGRVIPVKVEIFLGGVEQTNAQLAAGSVTIAVTKMTLCSSPDSDTIEEYADAGMSSGGTNEFRYTGDASGFWIYLLDTKALKLVSDQCYRLDVYIGEGASRFKISNDRFAVFKPTR